MVSEESCDTDYAENSAVIKGKEQNSKKPFGKKTKAVILNCNNICLFHYCFYCIFD